MRMTPNHGTDGSNGELMIDVQQVVVAVDSVTLLPPTSVRVKAGEIVVVRGKNGAGKSTLLKVLTGVRSPTGGTVTVGGEPVSRRNRAFRRRVASLISLPPLAPDLTVEDHVRLVAATWFDESADAERSASDALGALALDGLLHRFPHELSSGQQQLFALALVVARPFEVLVLDEPEQRLDDERLALVGDLLDKRRTDGVAIVIATHSAALTDRLADRVLDLDHPK
ncbi:ABC transporter [Rathayibacter rathayi]|nr:ABC transporter family protein [Rathayibacter rathayi]SOE05717.1 ABC transporter [Rathayibacter rathayi] [Rathayibacter rathayi NCPPB 2980 = VKM Ac-1601]